MAGVLQVRAHLNFELAANIEALKLTECHGVLGQGALHSKTAALPDRLSVSSFHHP